MSVREADIVAGDVRTSVPAPALAPPRSRLGGPWLMVVMLWGVAGIALMSVSFALARANVELDIARWLFWGALAAIGGSALMRMLAPSASRAERIWLVALTALLLYWVKVLHEPVTLRFSDEFFHLGNAQRIALTGHLYGENHVLPVSADYPGLPLVTVALSKLTGLGLFPCALIIIGLAKVALSVTLFLVFERLSGSARIAGLAALLYCTHSNYLFWSAQFSYESLSVPLLGAVLLCLVARTAAPRPRSMSWTAVGCLIIVAIAMTHHLTAFATAAILWVHVLLTRWAGRREVRPAIAMAVVATVAALFWVVVVAGGTGDYLGPIFKRLFGAVSRAVSEEAATRLPFQSTGIVGSDVGAAAPALDDRAFALGSVVIVSVGVIAGLFAARRRKWIDPLVVMLAVAAVGAVAAYPMRMFPGAWEIGNRTSDFLFLGVALVAAVGAIAFVDRGRWRWRAPLVAAAGTIAIAGGCVIGWPTSGRLPRPETAKVANAQITAPGPQMAHWARAHLPRDGGFVANDSNGRLLFVAGFARVWAGPVETIPELLGFDVIPQWQWDFIRKQRIDYLVLDRRVSGTDNVIGYFFARPDELDYPIIFNWHTVRRKFERLPESGRVFDNGDIVVYDIHRAREQPKPLPDDV